MQNIMYMKYIKCSVYVSIWNKAGRRRQSYSGVNVQLYKYCFIQLSFKSDIRIKKRETQNTVSVFTYVVIFPSDFFLISSYGFKSLSGAFPLFLVK